MCRMHGPLAGSPTGIRNARKRSNHGGSDGPQKGNHRHYSDSPQDNDRDRIARCKSARVRLASFVPDLLVALASCTRAGRPLATSARSVPELGCRCPLSRNLAVCLSALFVDYGQGRHCRTMINGRCALKSGHFPITCRTGQIDPKEKYGAGRPSRLGHCVGSNSEWRQPAGRSCGYNPDRLVF